MNLLSLPVMLIMINLGNAATGKDCENLVLALDSLKAKIVQQTNEFDLALNCEKCVKEDPSRINQIAKTGLELLKVDQSLSSAVENCWPRLEPKTHLAIANSYDGLNDFGFFKLYKKMSMMCSKLGICNKKSESSSFIDKMSKFGKVIENTDRVMYPENGTESISEAIALLKLRESQFDEKMKSFLSARSVFCEGGSYAGVNAKAELRGSLSQMIESLHAYKKQNEEVGLVGSKMKNTSENEKLQMSGDRSDSKKRMGINLIFADRLEPYYDEAYYSSENSTASLKSVLCLSASRGTSEENENSGEAR